MDKNRLRWACRRGMLELDLILEPFLNDYFDTLTAGQQMLFEKLLVQEDQDLFNWFIHKVVPTEPDIQTIVNLIRQSRKV